MIELCNLNPKRPKLRVLVAKEQMVVIILNGGREKALMDIEAREAKLNIVGVGERINFPRGF